MLDTKVDEIVYEDGKAAGVRSGEQVGVIYSYLHYFFSCSEGRESSHHRRRSVLFS